MSRSHQRRHSAGNPDTRRRVVAITAVVAAIATGATVVDSLASSDGGSSAARGYQASRAERPASIVQNQSVTIPAAYASGALRNPFKPLLTPPPPAAPATSPASRPSPTPTSSPTPVVIVLPPPTTNPSPTVTVTATPTPTGLPTAGQAITLTLVSVDGAAATVNATVTIGTTTTPYNNLKSGQVFGTYFKLVSVLSSDPSSPPVVYGADFEYGDQFVQLAEGDSSQFG